MVREQNDSTKNANEIFGENHVLDAISHGKSSFKNLSQSLS